MELKVVIDDKALQEAFARAPERMERTLDDGLSRAADEVARAAKLKVPSLFGTLANSILKTQEGPLHYAVYPAVGYAAAVERGTRPGYMPPPENLMGYIRSRGGYRGNLGKPGSPKRARQADDIRDRAWGLARYIRQRGTKAHPFMAPALSENESRLRQMIRLRLWDGAREAFGQ
jgi:hypothetical protein